MAIDTKIKKQVIGDWHKAFPQLKLHSQSKLYKTLGPLIIGVELIKLPKTDDYRPHFVIYPLWKENIRDCLDIPIMLKEYYNKKGLQFSIPYQRHNFFFDEILKSIERQNPLSFDGDISYKKLLSTLDNYSKTKPLSFAPNSYLQALLYSAKLQIALYISSKEAILILEEIKKKNWDRDSFNMWNIDVDKWLLSLKETVDDREKFLRKIKVNQEDKKIVEFNFSKLII